MISYDLSGKAALVTGAASGIGLATATQIAKYGAKVAINFLPDDARGKEAVAKLKAQGFDAIEAPGHVGHAGEAEKMVSRAIDQLGRLDLLVNNAGTPGVSEPVPMQRIDLMTEELWHQILETNLLGVFRCSKAAAPALKAARGAIVNTASVAAWGGGSTMAYGASKAAVVNLTKNLATALAPEVRVNAVAPRGVETPWLQWKEEWRKVSEEGSLLKRWARADELADVIVFLGFAATYVTSQTIVVDGG